MDVVPKPETPNLQATPARPRRIKMAAMAIRSKGELRRFYQKRRKRGLHHLSAVIAAALKLTRIVWRICTDQRDYLPAGRPVPSATRS